MPLNDALIVEFETGEHRLEKVVISEGEELPTKKRTRLLHREDLPMGGPYEMKILEGRKTVAQKSGRLPLDRSNVDGKALDVWRRLDKETLGKVPFLGDALEGLAPDAYWEYDLWCEFKVGADGRFEYRLHVGPTSNIDERDKLDGEAKLSVAEAA